MPIDWGRGEVIKQHSTLPSGCGSWGRLRRGRGRCCSPKPVARSGLGEGAGNHLLSWTCPALVLRMGRVSPRPHPPGADPGSVDEVSRASSSPQPSAEWVRGKSELSKREKGLRRGERSPQGCVSRVPASTHSSVASCPVCVWGWPMESVGGRAGRGMGWPLCSPSSRLPRGGGS